MGPRDFVFMVVMLGAICASGRQITANKVRHHGHLDQHIQRPPVGCPIQLASTFPKLGYLTTHNMHTHNQSLKLTTQRRSQKTLFYRADEKIDSTHNNELTLLTHAGMVDHLNTKYETPSYNVTAHRLVRKDDKLEAMNTTFENAARLVLRSWPQICGADSSVILNPPTFVQIMLLDTDNHYKGSMLNVELKPNGDEKITFITKQDDFYPSNECVSASEQYNPSVDSSTLFRVSYLPC